MLTFVSTDRRIVLSAANIEELMAEADNIYTDHFMPSDRRELIQTGERLAGLKEDFAELKRAIERGAEHSGARYDGVEARLRALENFRWWIVGAAAASGATAGFISRFFHP
jgi:hypothetical protein